MTVAVFPLLNETFAPVRFVPVIVTTVPSVPLVGLNPVIVGAGSTVYTPDEVTVPTPLVTLIGPVVTPVGVLAVIELSLVNDQVVEGMPLKLTPVVPVK